MLKINVFIAIFSFLFSSIADAGNSSIYDSPKIDRNGIQVYTFQTKNSDIATFKAVTRINASIDSILAIMFDNEACEEWVHTCNKSILLESINFNERYHYQILDVPFPFRNRDFIFHSIMTQDPKTKIVTITMSARPDYCHKNKLKLCQSYKTTEMIRVSKSLGQYTLQAVAGGTKITWIQHTDPEGNLPAWLVNQFLVDVPYFTFKKLSEKVKEKKYRSAKLVYDKNGVAIALHATQHVHVTADKDFMNTYQNYSYQETEIFLDYQ